MFHHCLSLIIFSFILLCWHWYYCFLNFLELYECTLAQALLFLSFLHWQINFFFFLLAGIYDLRLPNGGFKKGWILSSYYFQDFLTAWIQVYLYMSKFFKDKKIAQAHRASAIWSLWKIYKYSLHQTALEIILFC